MADLSSHLKAVDLAARRLQQQWDVTLDLWNDSVQHEFAERYYTQIQQEHRSMTKSATALAELLKNIQRTVR